MNGDVLLVRDKPSAVGEALDQLGPGLRAEMEPPLPVPAFPSRDDIRRQGKRTLVLLEGSEWTAITEGGDVADELLARALSRRLATECVVLGLYEAANAWARRHYLRGQVAEELFVPMEAFDPSLAEAESPDDASAACAGWLSSIGWPYGFPLFGQLIQGKLPGGAASSAATRKVIQ
jgi:hypothetical protein